MRLLADESLSGHVVRFLRGRHPEIDLLVAREIELDGRPDPDVREWAAANGRVVVAEDRDTMTGFAYDRVRAGLPMPGLVVVPQDLPVKRTVADIASLMEEAYYQSMDGRVEYLPLYKSWRVSEDEPDWAFTYA